MLLVAMPAATHAEYAAALGITRSRVTQMLHTVDRTVPVRSSPTAGHVTRWWSDRDPWDQAKAAYQWLEDNGSEPVLNTAGRGAETLDQMGEVVAGFARTRGPDDPATLDHRESLAAAFHNLGWHAGRLADAEPGRRLGVRGVG